MKRRRDQLLGWDLCIDDRLSLLRAVAKEKMPAEWLLYFKTGSLLRAPSFDAEVEVGETLRPFNPHKVGFNGRKTFNGQILGRILPKPGSIFMPQ